MGRQVYVIPTRMFATSLLYFEIGKDRQEAIIFSNAEGVNKAFFVEGKYEQCFVIYIDTLYRHGFL